MPLEHLFSPVRLGRMHVRNRLVMPPMSVNFGVDEQGLVTVRHRAYLAARARAGTGMIVAGGGAVHPDGLDLPKMPRAWDDLFIPALALLAAEFKAHGARIGRQLLHGGRQAFHDRRVAPSPLPSLAVVKGLPRELSRNEILELVGCHAEAARRAREAGFDFVEIHAAHGYLISELLSPNANRRSDDYGGCFEDRIRFLLEILAAPWAESKTPCWPTGSLPRAGPTSWPWAAPTSPTRSSPPKQRPRAGCKSSGRASDAAGAASKACWPSRRRCA